MTIKTSSVTATPVKPINQSTKKHLRGSTLLLAGRVISMATNFAIQVLTVRYLSKSDYGAFAYAMSLVSLGSSLAVFGLGKTITRFVPIYQEKGEYDKLFGTIIMVVSTILSLGLLLVLLVFGFSGWIAESLVNDQLAVRLLLLLIVLSPIEAVDNLLVGMLAIFASPRTIFFRRHVLGPGLKLLVVLLLVLIGSDVYFLASGYLASGALGVLIYTAILIRSLRNQELWKHLDHHKIKFPIKEIFGFSVPLFSTDLVYLIRHSLVVVMLEYFRSTLDVAAFRAVLPVAGLNMIVIQSFTFLFMPTVARMFANKDQEGIDDLYWQSAIWITVISLPIFLVTFSLAQPLTLLLFGERYAQSGLVMALLAFGYYFNAALGFNADTLRVYGNVRYIVAIDILAMLVSLGLSLILIPRFGALGAAIGTCGTLVVHNILNHTGLKFSTEINLFQWRYLKVYASIALGALGLLVFQILVAPPVYIGLILAGLLSLIILLINRNVLNVEQTFPELLRFKLVRVIFESKHKEYKAPK
jgi:O-antigen/teichoic acid export membrane protein